jgi:hypothetical protein
MCNMINWHTIARKIWSSRHRYRGFSKHYRGNSSRPGRRALGLQDVEEIDNGDKPCLRPSGLEVTWVTPPST